MAAVAMHEEPEGGKGGPTSTRRSSLREKPCDPRRMGPRTGGVNGKRAEDGANPPVSGASGPGDAGEESAGRSPWPAAAGARND